MSRLEQKVLIIENDLKIQQKIQSFLDSHNISCVFFEDTNDYLISNHHTEETIPICIVSSDTQNLEILFNKIHRNKITIKPIICSRTDIHQYSKLLYKYQVSFFISMLSEMWLWDLKCSINSIKNNTPIQVSDYFEKSTIRPITLEQHNKDKETKEPNYILETTIQSFQARKLIVNSISNLLFEKSNVGSTLVRFILNETTFNACIRAPVDTNGSPIFKEEFITSATISKLENKKFTTKEQIILQFGVYNDNLILSCKDFFGSLSISEILYRIQRHLNEQETGAMDLHGRGITFISEYSDRLIINVHPKRFTEIIILKNLKNPAPHRTVIAQTFAD